MMLLRILAGVALLVTGRKLFWLFVGLIGFMAGIRAGSHFFPGQPEWMVLAAVEQVYEKEKRTGKWRRKEGKQ